MNDKGFNLTLVGTDVLRTPISRNQIVMLTLGTMILLAIATFILLPLPFASSELSTSAMGTEADAARWIAVGERYQAGALAAEKASTANIARWNALGERYQVKALATQTGLRLETGMF